MRVLLILGVVRYFSSIHYRGIQCHQPERKKGIVKAVVNQLTSVLSNLTDFTAILSPLRVAIQTIFGL